MDRTQLAPREEPVIGFVSLAALVGERRRELVRRWEIEVRERLVDDSIACAEIVDTLTSFLDELTVELERALFPALGTHHTGPMSAVASAHGVQRLRLGFSVAEVVREYGLLHDAILALAEESHYALRPIESRVLSRAISRATASAVTEYARRRDDDQQQQTAEHFAFIAHELRNPLASARLAFAMLLRKGTVTPSRATEVVTRSLGRVGDLIDHALIAVRMRGKAPLRLERFPLQTLVEEAFGESSTDAEEKRITLTHACAPALEIEGDRRLLRSVVTNLVRNAIKFTREGGKVIVRASGDRERVRLEVEDTCGGIPSEQIERVFAPFVQAGDDRSGFGLGLAIARQAVEAHGGTIDVRNVDGGCVFVVELALNRA